MTKSELRQEVRHTVYLIDDQFERQVGCHPYILANPKLLKQTTSIIDALAQLYQDLGGPIRTPV